MKYYSSSYFIVMAVILFFYGTPVNSDNTIPTPCDKRIIDKTLEKKSQYKMMRLKNLLMNTSDSNGMSGSSAWKKPHSKHSSRLKLYTRNIVQAKSEKIEVIAFGDSLLDGSRKYLDVVDNRFNFSIGGSWAHHIKRMVEDIYDILIKTGKYKDVQYIIIGSLGGNPLLNHQPVDVTVEKSIEVLDTVRKLFPHQRIIVYGIPPTVNVYVNKHSLKFETKMYKWVARDNNSVILPLQKKFAGKLLFFPKEMMSSDGIHFTPLGICEFNILLYRAKSAPKGTIVD